MRFIRIWCCKLKFHWLELMCKDYFRDDVSGEDVNLYKCVVCEKIFMAESPYKFFKVEKEIFKPVLKGIR